MSLISVNNLTFGYDGSFNNIFENVSFNIDKDWKLVIKILVALIISIIVGVLSFYILGIYVLIGLNAGR